MSACKRVAAVTAALLCGAAGAAGCRPTPLWPLKNDVGGRCPYYRDLPRFEVTYSYGDGPARTTLHMGWLGAYVEAAGRRAGRPALTHARCFDHDTLYDLYARTAKVLPRVDDTFAPHGAAVLDAGWTESIDFVDEGKTRNTAWLSQGPGKEYELPPSLRGLLEFYGSMASILTSRTGSPPLVPRESKDEPSVDPGRGDDRGEGRLPPPVPKPPGP
jgi:hypothetical protein